MLFDNQTNCNFAAEASSPMSLIVSMAADLSTGFPIVRCFIFLAVCSATTYNARVACFEAKSAGFAAESKKFASVPFLGAHKTAFLFHVFRVLRLQMSFHFVLLQGFVRQHFVAQHTSCFYSTTITDRSESQIQKFLLVGTLSHPSKCL